MTYKSSDVVKLAPRGIAAVHDLTQAPPENALMNVLHYLWNAGGSDYSATIDEVTEGLNWTATGRTDFNREFQVLVDRKYATITSAIRPRGWDVELSSGVIRHEDSGTYNDMVNKYPLAVDIRKID
jgi:hypothetical protein